MKKVLILTTQDGDREALYINDKLIDEAEKLGEGDWRMFMLRMSEQYSFKSSDVSEKELTDYDNSSVTEYGSFPNKINHLTGEY